MQIRVEATFCNECGKVVSKDRWGMIDGSYNLTYYTANNHSHKATEFHFCGGDCLRNFLKREHEYKIVDETIQLALDNYKEQHDKMMKEKIMGAMCGT